MALLGKTAKRRASARRELGRSTLAFAPLLASPQSAVRPAGPPAASTPTQASSNNICTTACVAISCCHRKRCVAKETCQAAPTASSACTTASWPCIAASTSSVSPSAPVLPTIPGGQQRPPPPRTCATRRCALLRASGSPWARQPRRHRPLCSQCSSEPPHPKWPSRLVHSA